METADTAKPFGFFDAVGHTCTIYNAPSHDIRPSLNRVYVGAVMRKDELALRRTDELWSTNTHTSRLFIRC